MNIEEALKIGRKICSKYECNRCGIGCKSCSTCDFSINSFNPYEWASASYKEVYKCVKANATEMQRRLDEDWQQDGTRKYVRLDRFENMSELREAWAGNEKLEFKSKIAKLWETGSEGWDITESLESYRIPSALINFSTGMPKVEPKVNKIFLKVSNQGSLIVRIGDTVALWINVSGEVVSRLSDCQDIYNQWLKDGCPKENQKPIEWRGGSYVLQGCDMNLVRTDISCGYIFAFKHARIHSSCADDNIKRYDNGTPISY